MLPQVPEQKSSSCKWHVCLCIEGQDLSMFCEELPQHASLLEEVFNNADILGCIAGHLYLPDATRVQSALLSIPPGSGCLCLVLYFLGFSYLALCLQLSAVSKSVRATFRSNKIGHKPRLLIVASESNCLCELDLLTGELGQRYAVRPRARGWKRQKGGSLDYWPTCMAMHEGYIHICQYKVYR